MSKSADVTPEPVQTVEWWKSSVIATGLAVVSVLGSLDVWHPSQAQVTAFTGAAAVAVATIFPIIAFFVRRQVTPNGQVALTTSDAKLLHAAAAGPVTFVPSNSTAGTPSSTMTVIFPAAKPAPGGGDWADGDPVDVHP